MTTTMRYELLKNQTYCISINISQDSQLFAAVCEAQHVVVVIVAIAIAAVASVAAVAAVGAVVAMFAAVCEALHL